MSLYNMLFGQNQDATVLLACLGLKREDIGRYRDCYIDGDHIVIHTRTGGGNRENYEAENDRLTKHPCYVKDEDDDFDCTYANFYFRFPDEYAHDLKELAAQSQTIKPSKKWQLLLASFEASTKQAK